MLLLIPVNHPTDANDCGPFICCVVYAILSSFYKNRDFPKIDETNTNLNENTTTRIAFPSVKNCFGFDDMHLRCRIFRTDFIQLCLQIGYVYGQNPTITTKSSPTINSPSSHGGGHNVNEKREDCESIGSDDDQLSESESESENETKTKEKKFENENYTLRAGTKISFMSKQDLFLNPQCTKKTIGLILEVKPNWRNEEIPIRVDKGGPVYKYMFLSEVEGEKKYSFTMNDINLVTSVIGTASGSIDRDRKRNKTKSPEDMAQSLFEDAMKTFPNSHVKTVSLCPLFFFLWLYNFSFFFLLI